MNEKEKIQHLEWLLQGNLYDKYLYYRNLCNSYQANCISKDIIRKKIEEITSYAYTSAAERDCQDYAIQSLKELLGE